MAVKVEPMAEGSATLRATPRLAPDQGAGYTPAEQRALVLYLLSYAPDPKAPLPRPAPPPLLLRAALAALR